MITVDLAAVRLAITFLGEATAAELYGAEAVALALNARPGTKPRRGPVLFGVK